MLTHRDDYKRVYALDDAALREALVTAAAGRGERGYYRSRERVSPPTAGAGEKLRATVAAAVDADLATLLGGESALASLSLPGADDGFDAWVTTHAAGGGTQPV